MLLLLLSPIIYYLKQLTEKQELIVLRDVSASMDLTAGSSSKKAFLQEPGRLAIEKFTKQGYKVSQYDFAQGMNGDKGNTLLAPALDELAKKHDFTKVRGILLLSDGWLRDSSLQQIKQLGCPFYALADTLTPRNADLSVVKTVTNRHAYRNEPTLIRAEIRADNYNGPAEVRLLLDGKPVATQTVQLKSGVTANVDFQQRFARTGLHPFSVEVSAPGIRERSQNNNSYPGAVDVLTDKQQIVVLSDSPAWDNKFIVDAIAENARWEVGHYRVQGGQIFAGEKPVAAIAQTAPAAIVIINNGGLQLSGNPLNYVLESHRRGAGILYQGLPLAELSSVLPLQRSNVLTPYQGFFNLTPAAATYPMLSLDSSELQNIPPLDYYYVSAAPAAEILATINNPQNSPAIAVRASGNAKTLALAFLNLWKWQLQSESGSYKKMLANCLTWLSNSSQSGYNPIYNASYFLGEEIALRLHAEDDIRALRLDLNPELKIFDADNKEIFRDFMTQAEGEYSARLSLDKAGQYRFEISDKVSGEKSSGRFNVASASIEARDFDYNLPLLAWLASDTGGKLLAPAALQNFQPLPAPSRKLELRLDFPLYRKWYVLTAFILAFCLELFFRRRWGLL